MSAPTPSLLLVSIAPGTPALAGRPLIDAGQAGGLAGLFTVLGNDTRLRLLHAIHRGGEVRAGALANAVGMTQQAVSNQLQRLVDEKICATRRDGNGITTGSSIRACPACSRSDCACSTPRRRPGDSSRSRSVSHERPATATFVRPGRPSRKGSLVRPQRASGRGPGSSSPLRFGDDSREFLQRSWPAAWTGASGRGSPHGRGRRGSRTRSSRRPGCVGRSGKPVFAGLDPFGLDQLRGDSASFRKSRQQRLAGSAA